MKRSRLLWLGAVALSTAACAPMRINLVYGGRPPAAERRGSVAFGTITDERRNTRELGPDVQLAEGGPTVPETIGRIVRDSLGAAGTFIEDAAPVRVDARIQTLWAEQTFYRVQATVDVTVELVEVATARPLLTERITVAESSGGSDARANFQTAFKRALSRFGDRILSLNIP